MTPLTALLFAEIFDHLPPGVVNIVLELGGKDAFIVAEDADLDVAVPGVAWAALLNAGQVCTSTERVYVHNSILKPFTERLVEYVRALRLGPVLCQTSPDTRLVLRLLAGGRHT